MRIVAGDLSRRTLVAPKGDNTRPTTDRIREALFQHLESARLDEGFDGLRVLDLFAGSGALAFEAISRGASCATLVEADKSALVAIRENIAALGLRSEASVVAGKLPSALRRVTGSFDLVFADPPYATSTPFRSLVDDLRRLAAFNGLLVYEHSARTQPATLEGWTAPETRSYGGTHVSFYRRSPPNQEPTKPTNV
jgi:16S rRNA (guanine966-N2)-methyltransferase